MGSARDKVSARLTGLEKKTRLHGKFQPVLKLNVRAGTVVFYIYCCTQGFYACVYEVSARQPGLKFSSCNPRKLRFTEDFIGSLG